MYFSYSQTFPKLLNRVQEVLKPLKIWSVKSLLKFWVVDATDDTLGCWSCPVTLVSTNLAESTNSHAKLWLYISLGSDSLTSEITEITLFHPWPPPLREREADGSTVASEGISTAPHIYHKTHFSFICLRSLQSHFSHKHLCQDCWHLLSSLTSPESYIREYHRGITSR